MAVDHDDLVVRYGRLEIDPDRNAGRFKQRGARIFTLIRLVEDELGLQRPCLQPGASAHRWSCPRAIR